MSLYSQPQSIAAFWPILISRLAEDRRLSWPGWLGEILRWFVGPKTVACPSISRGGRKSNSEPSSRNAVSIGPLSHLGQTVTSGPTVEIFILRTFPRYSFTSSLFFVRSGRSKRSQTCKKICGVKKDEVDCMCYITVRVLSDNEIRWHIAVV